MENRNESTHSDTDDECGEGVQNGHSNGRKALQTGENEVHQHLWYYHSRSDDFAGKVGGIFAFGLLPYKRETQQNAEQRQRQHKD